MKEALSRLEETAPLDLETDSFYEARKGALLDKIEHGMAEELLIMSWESHVGTACRGVNWDKHSLSELRAAVTCIGGGLCLGSFSCETSRIINNHHSLKVNQCGEIRRTLCRL